ncbi:Gti1/Pac2 family protein [Cordyceps javanica]|uniref:Gti1/Pac2 family protein n=1 Tax=Cordyceps javanica TaxID=43265 RepID=A0A545USC1_9HYPO|nr:Gti1/Pac2 family protein [Cordyceps javanica]TQW04406.1 Gti1/Pac2 family protein [Cordyceps javanica]
MENQSTPLTPTFEGHIASTLDALLLFESCLDGTLNHVPRRPHDRERQELIKSGNIFIYEEHSSGIKRWTDGVSWSPSRILGNFLIYRELEKPFPPGEKKRALKKSKKSPQGIAKPEALSHPNMSYVTAGLDQSANTKDQERSLIGSLVDSYPFKTDGLVKKTISISYQGVAHHMVSYYNVDDVTSGKLDTPTNSILMRGVTPRSELFLAQNFRTPIDEVEYAVADHTEATPTHYGADQVSISNGSGVLHRAMMQGNLQNAMNIQQSSSSAAYVFPQHSPGTHNGYTGPVANSSFQAAMPQQMSLVAAPFIGYFVLHDSHAWAAGLLAYAGVTDLLDGWIARRWNRKTVVGTVIDPMADKVLMTVLTVCLAAKGALPVWVASIILGRDVGLGIAAIYYRWISLPPPKTFTRYWDFSLPSAEVRPTLISKYNTFLQLALVGVTTAAPLVPLDLSQALTTMQYVVAATTVWSGASYIYTKDAVKILKTPKKPEI